MLYQLSYLGADRGWCRTSTPRVSASGGRKDTDAAAPSQPMLSVVVDVAQGVPIRPAIPSRARMRSPMGGWVSQSDFARSSNDLIGFTM